VKSKGKVANPRTSGNPARNLNVKGKERKEKDDGKKKNRSAGGVKKKKRQTVPVKKT